MLSIRLNICNAQGFLADVNIESAPVGLKTAPIYIVLRTISYKQLLKAVGGSNMVELFPTHRKLEY